MAQKWPVGKQGVKHRVRTTGLEHGGQNSSSDPDQNLGFTCMFSSGMQENKFCPMDDIRRVFYGCHMVQLHLH